jgi:hypothetical protein
VALRQSGSAAPPPLWLMLLLVTFLCVANVSVLGHWRLELTWD